MQTELGALCRVLEKYLQISKMPHDFGVGELLYPSEIHLVSAIAGQEDISVTALAQQHGSTKGAVSQLLCKLEKKGLVTRRPDPHKRSRVLVATTPKGQAAHAKHCEFHARHDAPFIAYLGGLGNEEFRCFASLCVELEHWMDAYLRPDTPNAPPSPSKEQPE